MQKYCSSNALAALSLMLAANSVWAVPPTISYQGYLTDSAGIPINATVDATFRIYDVDTGGTDLWNETDSVVISDGKFTTPLGDGTAFPAGLFDNVSLYLGIEVETDGEMSPRKPLTTSPFAFKADDANTLQGMSASEFVLDSILILPSGEIHAVDGIDFANGGGSINGLDSLVFEPGVGGITYQDGSTQDTNAVNSILAADGSGSTLDADLVDGMQASEIIDAASDEVRTPIFDSDLPLTIDQSGSYYFAESMTHSGTTTNAITVNADDVTIDMMDFTLTGPGNTSGTGNYGIRITIQQNVTIKNGAIREFGHSGIYDNNGLGRAYRAINVGAISNGENGIYFSGLGNLVQSCYAHDNGNEGIRGGQGSVVRDSTSTNNGSYGITAGSVSQPNSATIVNNNAHSNGSYGIHSQGGAAIVGNSVGQNTGGGIASGAGSSVINNAAYRNGGLGGIVASTGSTVIGNTTYFNDEWGIYTSGDNLVENNTVHRNNQNDSAARGGMRISGDSRVVSNTVTDNEQYNIYVFGSDNLLEGNHVTDATDAAATGEGYGIYFASSDNFFRNNTATGNANASDYGGSIPPAARNVNNASW